MAPPAKKNVIKMDLNSFLNDDSLGDSWADDQVDLNNINLPLQNVAASNTIPLDQLASAGKGGHLDSALMPPKRERVEYPVPNKPPYRARISNLPWDVSDEGILAWTEDNLEKPGCVAKVVAPKDNDSDRLIGWAFVVFNEREDLVKALRLSGCKLNDRTVYVSVAAPKDFSGEEINFAGARGANFQSSAAFKDLDWTAAKGSNFKEKKPRREEPELSAEMRGANFRSADRMQESRGNSYESRERKPRRDEPELNWLEMRGANFKPEERTQESKGYSFEPRERKPRKSEPDLDWANMKGSNFHSGERRAKRSTQEFDFASARNGKPASVSAKKVETPAPKEETPKAKRSTYDVLHVDSDGDDEEEETEKPTEQNTAKDPVAEINQATNNLSLDEDAEWETVGKK
ncbi:HDL359Cp [Eremothecium sinecaudum]|uniref:HDL359Cp n=1 Tax=Eremothecium sinecaudum TaxID=45286 RepID=A0A120K246_9SACH|nr:HDL359Cp [Eremothecium sinecaudum]AMD20385.1 HDL359Cp [Eremothecium sinecaudum]